VPCWPIVYYFLRKSIFAAGYYFCSTAIAILFFGTVSISAVFAQDASQGIPAPGNAEAVEAIVKNYLAQHPEEIERIVRDYLARHPEVVRDAIAGLIKLRTPANADKSAAVKRNAPALFSSAHQVTLGNLQGNVTMVEFFDYNCGFCKRALADMLSLMKTDPQLKVVLKEFPVLGSGSVEVARAAIAVRMQDPTGAKYLDFHQKILGASGPANKALALAVAAEIGLDTASVEQDMASDEVRDTLEENWKLARALGINGTPSYVIGENVVVGAVGVAALKDKVQSRRQ
jgi:protein-disulfide isomerase